MISGKTTEGRPGMLTALEDAKAGKFDILIIKNTKRFGREALQILQNKTALENAGVELVAVTENLDNKLFTLLKAGLAEQEVEDIKERMMDGKIAKAKQGVPGGRLPYARRYDYKKEEWLENDKEKADKIRYAAQEYLKGRSMQKIAKEVGISYSHLINVIKYHSGDTWTEEYERLDEPVVHNVPPILDDDTIEKVTAQLKHNHSNNRTDTGSKYLLTGGYIYCWHCKKPLTGQTQHGKYKYYKHPSKIDEDCNHFTTVPMDKIDEQVFDMIFDDIGDAAGLEEAIKDNLPDADYIEDLKNKIEIRENRLEDINKKQDKLLDDYLKDKFKEEKIDRKTEELNKAENRVTEELEKYNNTLANSPDVEEVEKQAEEIRKQLLEKYQGKERFKEMDFDEKRKLLRFLFEGEDPEGRKYGIYIAKENDKISCSLYGRLRAYKHADDDGKSDRKPLFEVEEGEVISHKYSPYRTNNFSRLKK